MTSLRKKSVNTENKIKSKRDIIKDLMIKHQDLFDKEGVTNPKFIPRLCYLHKGEKIISFYPSEMNGKQDIYTEFCDRDLVPEDPERTLYKWIYNESYKEEYEASKPHPVTGDIRYFIPVDELVIVKDLHKTEIKAYLFEEHFDTGMDCKTDIERYWFQRRLCELKMRKEGKKYWGSKIGTNFKAIQKIWPNARVINVIRDIRDVYSSTLNTGAFEKTAEQLVYSWNKNHAKFRLFKEEHGMRGYELIYEDLAREPKQTIRSLCQTLNIPFSEEMLNFHSKNLTIFQTSHLSLDRLKKPIDPTKIGRWKEDLNSNQIAFLEANAGEMMQKLGYI